MLGDVLFMNISQHIAMKLSVRTGMPCRRAEKGRAVDYKVYELVALSYSSSLGLHTLPECSLHKEDI